MTDLISESGFTRTCPAPNTYGGLCHTHEALRGPPPSTTAADELPVYAAFPEFKERPLVSLLLELWITVRASEQSEVEPALEWALRLTPIRIEQLSLKQLGVEYKSAFSRRNWEHIK